MPAVLLRSTFKDTAIPNFSAVLKNPLQGFRVNCKSMPSLSPL